MLEFICSIDHDVVSVWVGEAPIMEDRGLRDPFKRLGSEYEAAIIVDKELGVIWLGQYEGIKGEENPINCGKLLENSFGINSTGRVDKAASWLYAKGVTNRHIRDLALEVRDALIVGRAKQRKGLKKEENQEQEANLNLHI